MTGAPAPGHPHAPLARVVAHRGASGDAPENTLAAIRLASEQGALAVEIDATTSADDVAFVHHDARLERCTSGTGALHEHDAHALDSVRAGGGRSGYEDEPLPRLADAIALAHALGMRLNVEIKPAPGRDVATAIGVCETVASCGAAIAGIVFSSFSTAALAEARRRLPAVPRALLVGAVPTRWREALAAEGSANLHCSAGGFDAGLAREIVAAGHGLYCYTVNDAPTARRLLDAGAHGVFTDHPARLAAALAST